MKKFSNEWPDMSTEKMVEFITGNKNPRKYIFDFRVMDESDEKKIRAKMVPGDFLKNDPRRPDEREFRSFRPIIGGLRFDGDDGLGPREAEDWEDDQRAAALAYHAETEMIKDLRDDPKELEARIKFLEKTNGMKLAVSKELQGKGPH
jgi:hypothetical protein